MKKWMILLTIVIFALTLAIHAIGAEQPKPGEKQPPQVPKLQCYIEGYQQRQIQPIPSGSTIECIDSVQLHLYVKNVGSGSAQGPISISGQVHRPCDKKAIGSGPTFAGLMVEYCDTPFNVTPRINLDPGNSVQVHFTQVDTSYCHDPLVRTSPLEVRTSAQIGSAGVDNLGGCEYRANVKTKYQLTRQ